MPGERQQYRLASHIFKEKKVKQAKPGEITRHFLKPNIMKLFFKRCIDFVFWVLLLLMILRGIFAFVDDFAERNENNPIAIQNFNELK